MTLPAAGYAEEILATLDRGPAYELIYDAKQGHWAARVYVTPKADPSTTPLAVGIKSVAEGTRTNPRLSSLFQVSPLQVQSSTAAYFDIQVSQDSAVVPGTYHASLMFDAKSIHQASTIDVTIPGANLSGPPSLRLSRVLYSPLSEENPALEVWETTGKSYADVRAQQIEPFADSAHQITGEVRLTPVTIAPGQPQKLPFHLEGNFPVGSSASKVALYSAQSPAPLVIPVQVLTRFSRWVLVVLIVTGLGFGFFARSVLKPQIAAGEAVQRAIELNTAMLKDELKGDAKFRREMAAARSGLESASRVDFPTEKSVSAAIETAEASRKKAFDELAARLTDAEMSIKLLGDFASSVWTLPPFINEVLAPLPQALSRGTQQYAESDAEGSLTTTRDVVEDLRRRLAEKIGDWRRQVGSVLSEFNRASLLVAVDRRDVLFGAIKTVTDLRDRVVIPPNASLADLSMALSAVDGTGAKLSDLISMFANEVVTSFGEMQEPLVGIQMPAKQAWSDMRTATEDFIEQLGSRGSPWEGAWSDLGLNATKLFESWKHAFWAQLEALLRYKPETNVEDIKSAFEGGNYRSAAEKLETALGTQKAGKTQGENDKTALAIPRGAFAAEKVAWRMYFSRSRPTVGLPAVRRPFVEPEPFSSFVIISRRKLWIAKAWQFAISWCGLTLIGYLIFGDKFIGTDMDLITAFLWGFTTDIGLDGLVAIAKGKVAA